ncbi:hypothetical protein IQ266_24295 [filamentous cyanobacterium LEGE 11480]|uniref:Knr4/Smi1-like domain-containing protein n=1 Tax=Romeriopsis navalis LEGE 11480 TaxID=2777977 RepID=A0A928VTP3_9CYAN|nr:hypothetical protein [Romeriopsis navalis]MBE9032861.1 hypothetical protein [Romeriopsis navalis LEGE 11480]
MSELTEALNSIEHWIAQHIPDHPAVMHPGLSRSEIELAVGHLPFKLSEEIYELYQWRNGGINPFIPHPDAWDLARFPALKETLANVDPDYPLFPLFNLEYGLYFVIGSEAACAALPIYCSDAPEECLEGEQAPQYESLTAMMQALAQELTARS